MAYTYAGLYLEAFFGPSGRLMPSTSVTVYLKGTDVLATLYTDREKSNTLSNPVETDSRGNLLFYADPGLYEGLVNDVRILLPVVQIEPSIVIGTVAPPNPAFGQLWLDTN